MVGDAIWSRRKKITLAIQADEAELGRREVKAGWKPV
jgi:hypothetical protein